MGLSEREAKALGIPLPPREKSLAKSVETKRRLDKEDSNTLALLFDLKAWGVAIPRSKFHPEGQYTFRGELQSYRFDLAWPALLLAVELQGIGHTRFKTFQADAQKFGEAVAGGWTVLPVVSKNIKDGRAGQWIARRYKVERARQEL